MAAGGRDHLVLHRLAGCSGLAEAGTEQHDPARAALTALVHDVEDARRRHGHDGKIRRHGQVVRRGDGVDAEHRVVLRVDGVHGPGEATGEDVAQHLVSDGLGPGTRADHGDRLRGEQRTQARGIGRALAIVDRGHDPRARLEVEREPDDAVLEAALGREAEVANHPDHRGVLGENLSHEPLDPVAPGDAGQMLDEQRADAFVLVVVVDEKCDLGRGPAQPFEGRHADQFVIDESHERLVLDAGRTKQALDIVVGGVAAQREEAVEDRLVGCPLVERQQGLSVALLYWPDVNQSPVSAHRIDVIARHWSSVANAATKCQGPRARFGEPSVRIT